MLTKNRTVGKDNIVYINKKYDLIKDAEQSLAETDCSTIILNICNNMNTFGAGFNKTIANSFPIAKEDYHLLGPTKLRNALGYTQFVPVKTNQKHRNQIIVANMICQTGILSDKNTRPLNYYLLGICLAKVQNYVKQYKKESDLPINIYCPKFNAGIYGADWSFIYQLILDTLRRPTFTHVYESSH